MTKSNVKKPHQLWRILNFFDQMNSEKNENEVWLSRLLPIFPPSILPEWLKRNPEVGKVVECKITKVEGLIFSSMFSFSASGNVLCMKHSLKKTTTKTKEGCFFEDSRQHNVSKYNIYRTLQLIYKKIYIKNVCWWF